MRTARHEERDVAWRAPLNSQARKTPTEAWNPGGGSNIQVVELSETVSYERLL